MEGCSYYSAMVLVQLAYGGSSFLIKLALAEGLHPRVPVVYRHVVAMLLVGPFEFVLERKQRPALSLSIAAKVFVLSFIWDYHPSQCLLYWFGIHFSDICLCSG